MLLTLPRARMLVGPTKEEANPLGIQRGWGRAHKCRDRPEMGAFIPSGRRVSTGTGQAGGGWLHFPEAGSKAVS